jgi:CubicO group peptidase (beta-lactamase class C family)
VIDERIAELYERAVSERVFPGGVTGYVRQGGAAVVRPFGRLTYEPDAPVVTAQTVYDVASITKAIPTSSIILTLVEDGRLSLDDKVVDFVPEIQARHREQILIRHLLTFTVMFGIGRRLADIARETPSRLLEVLFAAELVSTPGTRYNYSNAPSILLGLVAERICKQTLDEIAQEWFFEPLGMRLTTFHPEKLPREEVAPTERDWRGEIWGQVHDPGAWALRQEGRIAGHAGLFSTAGDLLRFAQMLLAGGELDGRRFFEPHTIQLMHTNQIAQLGGMTGLGWELRWPGVPLEAGSDQKFGKTGFTGCIILIDPVRQAAFVSLSNRIYPQRTDSREPLHKLWREVASLVLAD